MITLLVTGGRDYRDRQKVFETLDHYYTKIAKFHLIHGNAEGADMISALWAQERGVSVKAYPADWGRFKRRAGPIRNHEMLQEGKPDIVIAFPGGSGTAHMKEIARKAGVEVREIE